MRQDQQLLEKVAHRLREGSRQLHLDLGDYRRTVFLAGTGRSGTTWVENIINFDGSYRVMFEPFHSKKVELISQWNYRQYLPSEDKHEKFIEPAARILRGKVSHPWIDRYNTKLIATKRLIKDIRANLFLKWIKRNFPEIPIILLLRHPCAVASSKLKLGWQTHVDEFLKQDRLMADFLNPFRTQIEAAGDVFDKHIFLWCIENYVPLMQFEGGEVLVTFYEDLCLDAPNEMTRVLEFAGERFSPKVLEVAATPSAQSRKDSAIHSQASLVGAWRSSISKEQIARAVEILNLFGMDVLYGESDLPRVKGGEALRALKRRLPVNLTCPVG